MESLAMNPSFWRDRRVFITGHTGFKGSWLALWLQCAGARVTGYALRPPTDPSLFEQARVAEGMESILGDIRDLGRLRAAMEACRPEVVFHLAAQPLVRNGYQEPHETYTTNVIGTLNVLEAVRHTGGIHAVVVVTSDKCYENREWVWGYREDDPMGGHDPYSSSKACAELLTASYRRSFFPAHAYAEHHMALASARAGNVIGGGDWAQDRLIPDVMRAFLTERVPAIRNPRAIRPWQHVLEPLGGYLTLAERLWEQGPEFAEGWNFGPEERDARPVYWIVERLAGLWGWKGGWRLDDGDHPHEATYLKLDCSKARARLGWVPRWDLETALRLTVQWYRAFAAGEDVRRITEEQIRSYEEAS